MHKCGCAQVWTRANKKDTKPIAFIVEKNPAFLSSDPLWQLKIRVSQPLLHIFLNIPVKFVSCHECNVESLRCQFIICMKIAAELICTCYQTSGCFTGTGSYRSDTECDLRSSWSIAILETRWRHWGKICWVREGTDFICIEPSRVHPLLFPVKPYVAPHIRRNVHVPFYLRLELMFLPALFPPISAFQQPNRVDQFMWRRIVPYGAHLRQSRLPDETLGGNVGKGGAKKEGWKRKMHRSWRRGVWGKQAPKNNETKSEDKRGAISVAGFMYCQHYPRY